MIRKPPRLSDPVTGALLDPETGSVRGYRYRLLDKIPTCEGAPLEVLADGSLHDPSTGITIDICDVEADDA